MSHVLTGCSWVRESENKLHREDRFTWRHNNILFVLATVIKKHISKLSVDPERKSNRICGFVRAGDPTPRPTCMKPQGLLSLARDWTCNFDLPEFRVSSGAYLFPQEICATPLKIDGFIISKSRRLCILVELTAPMEHNIQKWHQSKLKKYESELEAERNGWKLLASSWKVGYHQV